MTPAVSVASGERLAVIDAAIYAAVFDSPVTFDELWRYSRVSIERKTLRALLNNDPALRNVLDEVDGLLWVRGIGSPPLGRRGRIDRSRALTRRARRIARIIRHIPFVRGVALTGSVAAEDAGPDADLDFLIIVAPRRLATTFLLLGGLSRIVGRHVLCPNYYLSADAIPRGSRCEYISREVAQARLLVGDRVWLDATSWVSEWFPNLEERDRADDALMRSGGWVQRVIERVLSGALGQRVESYAARLALVRLRAHYARFGEEPPVPVVEGLCSGTELRFHGGQLAECVKARYSSIRSSVHEILGGES